MTKANKDTRKKAEELMHAQDEVNEVFRELRKKRLELAAECCPYEVGDIETINGKKVIRPGYRFASKVQRGKPV